MIKAVIFDFDGVLVESVDIKTKAFAKLFEDEGDDIVRQVVDYHVMNTGVSRFDKFRHIYKNMLGRELTDKKFDELCARFSDLVLDEVVRAPYVKGAKDFLENYGSLYEFFISSATPQEEIGRIVSLKGIAGYFIGVYGSPKKKSEIVREILSGRGLNGADAAYVGDALSDLEAARVNGVNFIARLADNETLFQNVKCPKVRDLANLKDVIDSL